MELFVMWCGFIGAWLLFAGPIYQAAIELREEEVAGDRIQAVAHSIEQPPEISAWWWLVPPVKILLERRRTKVYRKAFVSVLSEDDIKAMVSFMNKATGWLFVAGGGLLIAVKETYELAVAAHWSMTIVWLLIALLAIASVANTAYRIARSEHVIAKASK